MTADIHTTNRISDEMPTPELRDAYRRVEDCRQRANIAHMELWRCYQYEYPYALIVSVDELNQRKRESLLADRALRNATRAFDRAEMAWRQAHPKDEPS